MAGVPGCGPIRIAIVDDHAMVRSGLRAFLADQVDMVVVAEGGTGRDAEKMARDTSVDVMLLDIAMPDHGGFDALKFLRVRAPGMRVIVLSAFPEETYAVAALRAGASGYLNKDCKPSDVLDAVRMVHSGRRYMPLSVAQLLAESQLGETARPAHELLSEREMQIFMRLAKGETAATIGENLALSSKTVSLYTKSVKGKLKLSSASQLTRYALKHGLIQ